MEPPMEQTAAWLNAVYTPLEIKACQLLQELHHRIFEARLGWYSGHYRLGTDREYHRDSFPIPVIEVTGYCDIEINLDCVTVTAKLKRTAALESAYEALPPFDAYGTEDYLLDFYRPGMSLADMKNAIRKSKEDEIAFNFRLDFETDGSTIYEFAKRLRREGFYH